jgi:hypothetical protein
VAGPLYLKREDVHELGRVQVARRSAGAREVPGGGAEASSRLDRQTTGAATAWAASEPGCGPSCSSPTARAPRRWRCSRTSARSSTPVGADLDDSKELGPRALPRRTDLRSRGRRRAGAVRRLRGHRQEILRQLGGPPDTVIVPVGNGALIIGVFRGIGRVSGVVAKEAPVMALSVEGGPAGRLRPAARPSPTAWPCAWRSRSRWRSCAASRSR